MRPGVIAGDYIAAPKQKIIAPLLLVEEGRDTTPPRSVQQSAAVVKAVLVPAAARINNARFEVMRDAYDDAIRRIGAHTFKVAAEED